MKIVLLVWLLAFSWQATAELPPEPIPSVATLPDEYPDSWIFAHDVNFGALVAGRVAIVDVSADSYEYKGMVDAGQFASFTESRTRKELYVAETFYSRTTRGERTDAVTIYDKSTLTPVDEILLPGGKRAQLVANEYTLQLIDRDRLLLVFNFTPAASVTVIDLANRKVIAEHEISGCGMIFPTGRRGFSTLCANGSMLTYQLKKDGSIRKQTRLEPFFSVDDDPVFDKPVYLNGRAYFPSFKGKVHVLDMKAGMPAVKDAWSLVSQQEMNQGWRPGGWEIIAGEGDNLIYVLMHAGGVDGSHKNGGSEVWVYDVGDKQRVRRLPLKTPGFSIEVVERDQDKSYLVVNNLSMNLDVYHTDGKHLRTLTGVGDMPISLHAQR